jgi:diacylglycerol kinase (ATP)
MSVKIALVYNPTAGGGRDVDGLVSLLTGAGHQVRRRSTKGDWQKVLQDPGDLVVAAGGDGTIRKVALAAADRGLPIAVLPTGTANNIAKSLGMLGDARQLVASWSEAPRYELSLDFGEVSASSGTDRFVEAFGGGLVADLIARGDEVESDGGHLLGRETDRALHLLADLVREAPTHGWEIMADGADRSGAYLAVEVMNIRFVGPNVPIAAEADPADGMLDLVLIGDEDREPLLAYLENRLHRASGQMPRLRAVRAKRMTLVAPAGVRLHLDDAAWPTNRPLTDPARLAVRCLPASAILIGATSRA